MLKSKAARIFYVTLGLCLFFIPLCQAAEGGLLSGTLDAAGDILALPFRLVGGLFRVVF